MNKIGREPLEQELPDDGSAIDEEILEPGADDFDEGSGPDELMETAAIETAEENIETDDDDGASPDMMSCFSRLLTKPGCQKLTHEAFNALARRLVAFKREARIQIEELIASDAPSSRRTAFVKKFGAPKDTADLPEWLDDIIANDLTAVFGFFGIREAERIVDEMCRTNFRLVVSIAKRSPWLRNIPLIDLIQEGNEGLLKAVIRFDPERGYRFSTFASWWIKHYVNRMPIDTGRMIRIPVQEASLFGRISRLAEKLGLDIWHTSQETVRLIAEVNGISIAQTERALMAMTSVQEVMSLDRRLTEDGDSLLETVPDTAVVRPDHSFEQKETRERLLEMIEKLCKQSGGRDWSIVRRLYGLDGGDPQTLREVGLAYGLSHERIRQLRDRLIVRLRHALARERVRP